ncbi:MAG: TolC family protein [Vicinamibacteraceae bacterium]
MFAVLILFPAFVNAQESPDPSSLAPDRSTRQAQEPDWLLPAVGPERAIDLAEALDLAHRQSIEGRRAAAQTRIAEDEARESRVTWIPSIDASVGASQTDGQVQGSFGDFQGVDFSSTAPFARVGFALNPFETWQTVAAATERAGGVAADEAAVRRTVDVRVAELYYELARERAAVRVERAAVQEARDFVRIAEVLLRNGMGRGDDAARARAQLADAEGRQIAAERRFQIASVNLATALNLDPLVRLVPRGDLSASMAEVQPLLTSSVDTLVRQALEWRPEVRAERQRVEAARKERGAARWRVASPTFEAFYQRGFTGVSYANLGDLSRYGVAATWTVSAANMQRVRTAGDRVRESSLALEQATQQVRADVISAWTDVQAAAARREKARTGREAAEGALRISQVRFRNGTSLAVEVLEAQRALDQARLAEVEAQADAAQAAARLRAELGPLTSDK